MYSRCVSVFGDVPAFFYVIHITQHVLDSVPSESIYGGVLFFHAQCVVVSHDAPSPTGWLSRETA